MGPAFTTSLGSLYRASSLLIRAARGDWRGTLHAVLGLVMVIHSPQAAQAILHPPPPVGPPPFLSLCYVVLFVSSPPPT